MPQTWPFQLIIDFFYLGMAPTWLFYEALPSSLLTHNDKDYNIKFSNKRMKSYSIRANSLEKKQNSINNNYYSSKSHKKASC